MVHPLPRLHVLPRSGVHAPVQAPVLPEASGGPRGAGRSRMIVAIGGPPGGGKTTAADLYARTYKAVFISGGGIFREMAAERGMDLVRFSKYAEAHYEVDRQLDEMILAAVRKAVREGKDVVV